MVKSRPSIPATTKKRQFALDGLTILCLYLLICPLWAMPVYEKLVLFPDKRICKEYADFEFDQIRRDYGIKVKPVSFQSSNGTTLNGWYFDRHQSSKVLLVSHGNAGNISHRLVLARAILDCQTSVFLYDYEGYGMSEGTPSIKNICQDGLAAYDYLISTEHKKPEDIIVYGESIGTGVTTQIANSRIVGGLILQSGFPSLLYAAHDRLWFTWLYPDNWYQDLDNAAVVKKKHPKLLIIHGRDDSIFPLQYAKVLYSKAAEPKQLAVLDDMGHIVDEKDRAQFARIVTQFISETSRVPDLSQSGKPAQRSTEL